ncbi:MAG TPA: dephospho-CoA kinase [Polyangia bacterium]|jgi:dephospho-CoA kinase
MGTRVIGLTGGIASGKSTVGRMLADLGATVLDADAVAREVTRPGTPALAAIVAAFGAEVLTPGGELDRKRLGERVFADDAARRRLNAIVHPHIGAETGRRIAELRQRHVAVVVYEASLLVEHGLHRALDGLIVVAAPPDVQVQRVVQRDGLTPEQAEQRLAAQLPLAAKIAVADYVIDGAEPLERVRAQVQAAWDAILRGPDRNGEP